MKPSDQLTWGQCFKLAAKQTWPLLWVLPVTSVITYFFLQYALTPEGRNDPKTIELTHFLYWSMPLLCVFLLTMIYLNTAIQIRWQETPSQREIRERRMLDKLKEKYEKGS